MRYKLIIRVKFSRNELEEKITEQFKTFSEAFNAASDLIDNTVSKCTILDKDQPNTYILFDLPKTRNPVQYKYKITTNYNYTSAMTVFKEVVFYFDKEAMLAEYKYLRDRIGRFPVNFVDVISTNYRTLRK